MNKIKCACGQHIVRCDCVNVFDIDPEGSCQVIYVKFRCPRCKRYSERFIDKSMWQGFLVSYSDEVQEDKITVFRIKGPISDTECDKFKKSLKKIRTSEELAKNDI